MDKIYIDGVCIHYPKNTSSHKITNINDSLYVDGYEYKNGEWKKTLVAWWHKHF